MNKIVLEEWFKDFQKNIENKTKIILETNKIFNDKYFVNLSNLRINKYKYEIFVLNEDERTAIKNLNNKMLNEFYANLFENPIIVIVDNNSISKFNELIANKNNKNLSEIDFYVLEKMEFVDFLNMKQVDLCKLLKKRVNCINLFSHEKFIYEDNSFDILFKFFFQHKILKASFANFIYKIFTLELAASSTKIGIKIREEIGIKSKTIHNIDIVSKKHLRMNPFKGYDLSYGIGFDIKKEIADKLILLNVKELDLDKICEITNLPKTIFMNKKNTKIPKVMYVVEDFIVDNLLK